MVPLALTTLEKLEAVPAHFWMNVLIVILGGVIAFLLLRHAKQMNRTVLTMIIGVFMVTVFFHWVYERNEPAVLTPFVNILAHFLPTKGYYSTR